jgi:predicted protein tyrosine phosphatase
MSEHEDTNNTASTPRRAKYTIASTPTAKHESHKRSHEMTTTSAPQLMVTTRWEAARWCHRYESVLTVFAPGWMCDFGHDDHLIVEFEDRLQPDQGAPTLAHAEQILSWAQPRLDRSILVHCKAGQSRSTASAIGIAALAGMSEPEAWNHVASLCRPPDKLKTRPFIPNLRLLGHFDVLLDLELLSYAMATHENHGHVELA